MYIGLRAHDYGKLPVEELFKRISEDGFHAVQLAIPKAIEGINSLDEVDEKLLQEIKGAMEKYNIAIPVFGCYVELGHRDPIERQKHVDRFLKGMEIAKSLGARCIGSETTHFPLDGKEEEREGAFEGLVDSVKQIVKKGEEIGLDVAIEPVAKHTLNTPELANKLYERVPSERLKFILDLVNLLTEENIHKQDEILDKCFTLWGDKIWALHMKGIKVNEEGKLEQATFEENEANFKKVIDWVKVNMPETTVLREEIEPAHAKADYAYMKALIEG